MIPKALRALVGVACLTGCATSAGTASLADGRTGTFSILTLTYPTRPGAIEQPASVTGDLSLPAGSGRVPAVIVLHSCAGVTPEIGDWARTLNGMGYAALVVDSFTARGVTEVCTGHQSINPGSRLADLFRAHELLATHPRIDPQRIAVLGFAYGGWITLWASHDWYQRRFMRGTVPTPAAYAAFYPAGCNVRLLQEADVRGPSLNKSAARRCRRAAEVFGYAAYFSSVFGERIGVTGCSAFCTGAGTIGSGVGELSVGVGDVSGVASVVGAARLVEPVDVVSVGDDAALL